MQFTQQAAPQHQDAQNNNFMNYPQQPNQDRRRLFRHNNGMSQYREEGQDYVEIKLCIHQKSCGPVIGKSGAVIKEIQTNCNVNMQLDDSSEVFQQTYDRALLIKGGVENIKRAVEVLIPKLAVEFEIAKEPHFDANIVIPTESVGGLIGKAGSGIRTIADETKTKIRVTNDIDAIPQSTTRLVRIAGAPEDVEVAKNRIMSQVEGAVPLEDYTNDISMRMLIPHGSVGLVIGKGGSKIKEIADQSQCKIQLSLEKDVVSGLNVRAIDLSGPCENVRKAKETIDGIVKKGIEDNIVDTKIIVIKIALNSNLIGFVIGRNGDNIRNINKQTHAHVKILQKENYQNPVYECPVILTGQPEWVINALGLLAQKLIDTPDQLKSVQPPRNNGYHYAPYTNYAYINSSTAANFTKNGSNNANNKTNSPSSSPIKSSNNSAMNNTKSNTPKQELNYSTISGSVQSREIKIAVPIEATGKIIGKGGNIIRFIVSNTQAHIKVQTKNELDPNSTEREMTLSGEEQDIQKALDLIKQFMNSNPEQISNVMLQSGNNNNTMNQSGYNQHQFNNYPSNNYSYYQAAAPSYSNYPFNNGYNYAYNLASNIVYPSNATTLSTPATAPVQATNAQSSIANGNYANQEAPEMTMEANTSAASATAPVDATNTGSNTTGTTLPAFLYNGYSAPYSVNGSNQFNGYSYSQ